MISGRISAVVAGIALLAFAPVGFAQSIVSAKSGAIHHVEGEASIDGKEVHAKLAEFPNLNEGSTLRTEIGRVEMLLTPGVIVRLGENSAIRMISNKLADTRLELVEGTALVEAMEILKENAVTFASKNAEIQLLENGLYRIEADPAQLRVYDGKAEVISGDQKLIAKKGRLVDLDGPTLAAAKFDSKKGDSLYRWSYRRSGYLSMANLSAAKSINDWGMPWSSRGGWYWNPFFGMFTFVPSTGIFNSPFGFSYWSPARAYYLYSAPRSPSWAGGGGGGGSTSGYNADRGYVTVGGRSAGGMVSAPSSPSPAAASTASPRGSSGASSRGDSGGGRGR